MKHLSFIIHAHCCKPKLYNIVICILLLIPLLLIRCNYSIAPAAEKAEMRIDVESDFNDDHVKILFDNNILLDEKITTNYTISAAWLSGTVETTAGVHKIQVDIQSPHVSSTYLVKTGEFKTLRINYLRDKRKITFDEFKGIILRD